MEQEKIRSMKCKFCFSNTEKIFDNGVQCKKCKTVQVIRMPSDNEIKTFYLEFNKKYKGGGSGNNQSKYAHSYLKLIKKHCLDFNSILDIGCSNSPFPNMANRDNYAVSVLDIVKPSSLDTNVTYYKGLVDNGYSIPEKIKFDIITAWAVIEHVKDVPLSFKNVSSSLVDNGFFVITTPEIGTPLANLNLGKTPWFNPPEHLHILSPNCLIEIASRYGFVLINKGHFEISIIRYFIRYYIYGFIEALFSICVRTFSLKKYKQIQRKRISSYKGIQYLVFKKSVHMN